jgi:hypothetical protein
MSQNHPSHHSQTVSSQASGQSQTRLSLIKNGFKSFVNPNKLAMSGETKWTLEIVCLNDQPPSPQVFQSQNRTVYEQASNYLQNYLYNYQTNINQNKQSWINAMKQN